VKLPIEQSGILPQDKPILTPAVFVARMETRIAATKHATITPNQPQGTPDIMSEWHWKQLYQYWLSKHVDGHAPARGDIDPIIDIPHLAKNLMLLDARDKFTYRLVGSEVVDRHGFNMTGRKSGSSGKEAKAISEWMAALDYVSSALKPRLLVSRIGNDEVARNVMILLPLADKQGQIEMVLVGSFYNEHFTRGTRIADMVAQEIDIG
jgi:hypothetical protein